MTDSSPAYGSLPFKDQITFFRAKRNVLTESWTDLWEAEHDHGFMVAGANRIDLLVDLRAAVDKAIADGTGLRQFRKDFDTIVEKHGWQYNGGRNWRTRVIFETNLRTSYAAGRYAQLQELKQVRPYWRYRHSDAVMHPRPQHLAWDGLVLHADDPWWNTHFPPNGWGCFLPGTRIRGPLQLGLKTLYAGPAVEIHAASGSVLRVTANHPVLTCRGWLAAGQIKKGDQLVHSKGCINAELAVVIDNKQPPVLVEDAFQALAAKGLRVADMAPLDLHGDAQFGKGKIHVAGCDRVLRNGHQATALHFDQYGTLETTDAGEPYLARASAGTAHANARGADVPLAENVINAGLAHAHLASNLPNREIAAGIQRDHFGLHSVIARIRRAPGGTHLPLNGATIAADALPTQLQRGTASPLVDTPQAQQSIDGLPAAPVLLRQLLRGDPTLVALDHVVGIRKFKWSGHVYDFQTPTHLVVADGIVAHNCQCTVEALNARDLAKLGKSGPDTAPALNLETVTVGKNGASPHTVQVPAGIDPGFGYAPGKSAYAGERPGPASTPAAPATARVTPIEPAVFDRLAQDLLNKATRLPAGPGAQALADVLERPRVQQALDEAYTAARTGLQQTAPPADAPPLMVGALNAAQVQAMTRVGLNPTAAPIGAALGLIARSALATLPRLLRSAQAVLLDALTSELLYVQGAADAAGTVQVATVRVGTGAAASNTYASDGRLSLAYLRQQVQGGQLQLIQGAL